MKESVSRPVTIFGEASKQREGDLSELVASWHWIYFNRCGTQFSSEKSNQVPLIHSFGHGMGAKI